MQSQDPFEKTFGTVRLFVDKIKEFEDRGYIYGLRNYLRNAIIVTKDTQYPYLFEVYIPGFLFYFRFVIDQDPKTKQPMLADFMVQFPMMTKDESETGNDEEEENNNDNDNEDTESNPIQDINNILKDLPKGGKIVR